MFELIYKIGSKEVRNYRVCLLEKGEGNCDILISIYSDSTRNVFILNSILGLCNSNLNAQVTIAGDSKY